MDINKKDLFIKTITDLISRIEQVKGKFKQGTSQATLAERRIKALHLSLDLLKLGQDENLSESQYSKAEKEAALFQIESIIRKSEKAILKLKVNSLQYVQTEKMLACLRTVKTLLEEELNKEVNV